MKVYGASGCVSGCIRSGESVLDGFLGWCELWLIRKKFLKSRDL